MACSTGEACGLTDTRSSACSSENHSAVMMPTMDALEAWCPPTLTPSGLSRPRLAASTIAVDIHNTRWAISSSTEESSDVTADSGREFTLGGSSCVDVSKWWRSSSRTGSSGVPARCSCAPKAAPRLVMPAGFRQRAYHRQVWHVADPREATRSTFWSPWGRYPRALQLCWMMKRELYRDGAGVYCGHRGRNH